MKRLEIKEVYKKSNKLEGKKVRISGWIKTVRDNGSFAFIELNDGSGLKNMQIVVKNDIDNFESVVKQNVGAALTVEGTLVLTPKMKQPCEVQADKVIVEAPSSPSYPLQKKRHTFEYLREIAHLRPRTNTFLALFRVRSVAAQALHEFFAKNNFIYVHTPIITGSDAEGAGEMFQVTTLDLDNVPKTKSGKVDYKKDFFLKESHLTVSGQLNAECYALAFSKVYTFGPTFRAEKSNTQRHAAEFWMLEPEIAFADLNDNMKLIEDMLKYTVKKVLERCSDEIEFFNRFIYKGLKDRLNKIVNDKFEKITYTKAIDILLKSKEKFKYDVKWGIDLQTEHERYLTDKVFKCSVFVTDYPKDIKAFYMRLNPDNKTVAAVDLLVPEVGELVGGSQREERIDYLEKRIEELNLSKEEYDWYIDLRRFGGVEHAGFGLGFERLIMYLTGMENIRDVIPFPRTTGQSSF